MPDDVTLDPNGSTVVEPPAQTSTAVETPQVETPPVAEPPAAEGQEPHPLEPQGDRFKQVWARAKTAEAERERLRDELAREREERIRFEERLKAKDEVTRKANEPEFTWDQLEAAISEGRITRAWANTYREDLVAKKAKQEALAEIESKQKLQSRESSVVSEIERYKQALPEVMNPASQERQKVEREYGYMVNVLGFPEGTATQLAALRASLGDADTVERTVKARQHAPKESFMETHSSSNKPHHTASRLVDKLDSRQKEHYEKMIRNGRYAGWDEVEAELKWTPPSRGVRRG